MKALALKSKILQCPMEAPHQEPSSSNMTHNTFNKVVNVTVFNSMGGKDIGSCIIDFYLDWSIPELCSFSLTITHLTPKMFK